MRLQADLAAANAGRRLPDVRRQSLFISAQIDCDCSPI